MQTAWRWHLKEETGLETTTLATQGLQRQDETVEFTSTNMSSRQSSRLRGEPASTNTEEEADSHMAETRTPSAGSKRAPATSLTPDRDRSTQMQKTHDLPPDEQMQENPAQVTPMGTAKTDTPSDTGLKLSTANFPPLSPLKQKNPGITNTETPLAEPPAVPHIPEGKESQANTSSQQDTSVGIWEFPVLGDSNMSPQSSVTKIVNFSLRALGPPIISKPSVNESLKTLHGSWPNLIQAKIRRQWPMASLSAGPVS